MASRTSCLHALQFRGRGRAIGIADFVDAHGSGADKGRDIAGDAALDEVVQVFGQRGPLDGILDVALLLAHLPLHRVGERPHGRAFAQDFERHALADVALRAAILEEGAVGPTQHVDEPRGDRETPGVQLRPAARAPQLADGRDGLPVDGEVAGHRRPAAAIVDHAVADEEVVFSAHSPSWFTRAVANPRRESPVVKRTAGWVAWLQRVLMCGSSMGTCRPMTSGRLGRERRGAREVRWRGHEGGS